jgi:hypothetical protein
MIKPISKPGPKPKKPRKALKRTAINPARVTSAKLTYDGTAPTLPTRGAISRVAGTLGIKAKRAALPKTNPERKRERHMRDFDGGIEHDHFVRATGCALARCEGFRCDGPIQAAHVRPRSTGGHWFNLVGLCERHHRTQEEFGNEYLRLATGVNLGALAQELAERNLKEKGAI